MSPLFPHNGSRWRGCALPAAERRAWPCLAAPELLVLPRGCPSCTAGTGHRKTTSQVISQGSSQRLRSRGCSRQRLKRAAAPGLAAPSPAPWAAIRQFPVALGFPSLSRKFLQSSWFVAQPVLPALLSHHPVLPHVFGNSPPLLGVGRAAAAATLAAERRASSTGRQGGQESASPGQHSSCAQPRSALPLPPIPASPGTERFGNSLSAETRCLGQLAGQSRPIPRQPRLQLETADSLSARLHYQPQRCPLDGKHLVHLAVRRGHLLGGEGWLRGTGTILNKLQL